MELRYKLGMLLMVFVAISCSSEDKSDAYGQFEVDATIISSEAAGKLLSFDVAEGKRLAASEVVGLIDTVQLHLKKKELEATIQSVKTKIGTLNAQSNVYESQLVTANKELARIESLRKENASTQQQLDAASGQVVTLQSQVQAVEIQKKSVNAEVEVAHIKIAQLEDQLSRAVITNPIKGIVLNKFVEPFELVGQGRPLYEIANLDELMLRVYVDGAQLPNIKLGQEVEVLIDKDAKMNQRLVGNVMWISSEAEFTPKMIQTKEERVTQVYAVKVKVANPDGVIKIGMPGEVNFK
ncbi:MAG: HlyD family efflux transporter periplasmic adaptor subunit [Balneolaceae bacterium]